MVGFVPEEYYEKPYSGKKEFSIGDGLSVRVSPKGQIAWQARVRMNGRPMRIPLGYYPIINERKARSALELARIKVRKGENPKGVVADHKKKARPSVDYESGVEGFVYIAVDSDDENAVKIGASHDPSGRIMKISRSYDRSFSLYAQFSSQDMYGLENLSHKALIEFHIERELYRIDKKDVLSIIAGLT